MRLALGLLVLAMVLQGAIARIAYESAAGGGGATTSAIDTTGASLLVAMVHDTGQTWDGYDPVVSDSKSNTWAQGTTYGDSTTRITVFYAYVSLSVGSGHTVTVSHPGRSAAFTFAAYSGTLTTSDPADKSNGGRVGWGGPYQPGSITPAENGSLIVFALQPGNEAITVTAVSDSFTIVDHSPLSGGFNTAYTELVQTTAAAINPSATLSSHDSTSVAIYNFLPAPAASPRRKTRVVFQ